MTLTENDPLNSIIISGGGLVGSFLAMALSKKGFKVTVYEKRPDPRINNKDQGRSINLVVTSRGLHAFEKVGLKENILSMSKPVWGRMMHSSSGELTYQPYGAFENECNYSISRLELNRFLIDEAIKEGVHFHFQSPITHIQLDEDQTHLTAGPETLTVSAQTPIIGADGVGSFIRQKINSLLPANSFNKLEEISHGYKELLMPAGPEEEFLIDPKSLHIWPRSNFMLMALPNLDGSFTCTLYLPHEDEHSFQEIQSNPQVLQDFFRKHFPDTLPLLPHLAEEYAANKIGKLGTVYQDHWFYENKLLLIGDAAHGIVPFFGQGLNCGLEDCTTLLNLIDESSSPLGTHFKAFEKARKKHAQAIAQMSLENFIEMRQKVGDKKFLLKKSVEKAIEKKFPELYKSRYSLIMYHLTPYAHAMEIGKAQNNFLDNVCQDLQSVDELNFSKVKEKIVQDLGPLDSLWK